MGKGWVRFKKLQDLALDVVGRTVARVPGGSELAVLVLEQDVERRE